MNSLINTNGRILLIFLLLEARDTTISRSSKLGIIGNRREKMNLLLVGRLLLLR